MMKRKTYAYLNFPTRKEVDKEEVKKQEEAKVKNTKTK